ncbi:MAG TPA: tRNA (N(6)-L-threonylcarbamoyladenosine(37)-C(2))-methylthiotransferase MtaB [Candidatus Rokubacteria bacterium]|nr:MAG: tRNA (N(6)-L-threonylcarbamoyladenosine(37)-C(2))-methylthiotransferase MtaB [Candidatus Rokubacteria bacterium GWF2_70_14]HAM56975.1 tRNA (N(6)-L-threonylcarbamoyladenosine(37)-C(2))-methylthiotransferase MtaB [Candidatus Rokubacteria bacterium]
MTTRAITVGVATLGCRLNQVESQEMLGLVEAQGFRPVAGAERAEVYVVNTCTVTGRADVSDRQLIRRITRERPGALVVVTGCWAQTDPQAVARIPGVDLVLGNQEKYRLPELVAALLAQRPEHQAVDGRGPEIRVAPIAEARSVPAAPLARVAGRSRAFVKIQDGCQHRCAFCIVPAARGASRSQDPEVVLDRVRALIEAGHGEITLTGVDLGHYGWDLLPRTTLAVLLRQLAEVAGLRWLRLSSILPAYVTADLLEVITGSPRVAPHLHLPLQSGSDRVLRLMRRPYNTRMYRTLVERLARDLPDLGLGADLIVGHPGESEADFAETRALVSGLPFSYLHVFSYSDRKGTESTRLTDRVPAQTIRARSAALRQLGREKALAFRQRMLGRTHEALVLEARDRATGLLSGLTANYVEVLFDGPDRLARRFVPVTITDCRPEGTFGRLEGSIA